jgi:hypothetical protein
MGGICSMHEKMRNTCKIIFRKPEVKRLLRRLGHRWEDYKQMCCTETGYEGTIYIHLAQCRMC